MQAPSKRIDHIELSFIDYFLIVYDGCSQLIRSLNY
jgi:hypothetical protein